MLRITKVAESPLTVTLKVEGRIISDWGSVLERECLNVIQAKQQVLLDFSEVTYIDGRGVEMLKRIAMEHLKIINCSALIEGLLTGRK